MKVIQDCSFYFLALGYTACQALAQTSQAAESTDVVSVQDAPAGLSQPDAVGNYNWYGCRTEATNGRALRLFDFADDEMTLESCRAFCDDKGTIFFGTEYGRECYCGEALNGDSTERPAGECGMVCAGDRGQFCGAGDRLSVYRLPV